MELKEEYKQSELGVIPDDWDVVPISTLLEKGARITYGVVQPGKHLDSGVLFVRGGDIFAGKIDIQNLRRIPHEISNNYKRTILHGGEILISLVGYPGEAAIVPDSLAGANIARQAALIRLNKEKSISAPYVCSFLLSETGKRLLLNETFGSAQQVINLKDINKLVILLPREEAEQEAIAEALSDADAYIESLEKLIAKKRLIKQGAMQELLTGKLRLPGFSGEWTKSKLSSLCELKSGAGITSKDINPTSGFPCYGGNGLRGFATRYTHEGAYALIGRVGALCGNIQLVEGRFFASEHTLIVYVSAGVDIGWLSIVLREMNLNQYAESSAQPVLTATKLGVLEINHPSNSGEQHAIYEIVKAFDEEILMISKQLGKAKQIKQGMMQELLTGRIRLV
jgi:type I restriction enzyme, S subunit